MFEILLSIPSFLFEENAFSNAAFKIYVNCVSNFFILIWWDFVARFSGIILRLYIISPIFLLTVLKSRKLAYFDILAKLIYL